MWFGSNLEHSNFNVWRGTRPLKSLRSKRKQWRPEQSNNDLFDNVHTVMWNMTNKLHILTNNFNLSLFYKRMHEFIRDLNISQNEISAWFFITTVNVYYNFERKHGILVSQIMKNI